MAGRWRYLAQRMTSDGPGDFIHTDLPLSDVEIEQVLSGHNSLNAAVEGRWASMIGDDGLPILKPWHTAIYAESDGTIHGGGLVVDRTFEGSQMQLDCIGFTGYSVDMPYTSAWYGVEIDPLDVVRHIWEHMQSQPGGNLDLEVSALKTGLKIGTELKQGEFDTENGPLTFESGPIRLAWYDTHDLSKVVDELAEATPFDYLERHAWDGDTIRHYLDFGYPRIGQRRDNLRLVFGENIWQTPTIETLGEDYATEALVLGAGEGRTMKRGTHRGPQSGLRRVAVVADSSLRSQRAVDTRARAEVQWRGETQDITSIEVRDTRSAPITALGVGDEVRLQGRSSVWTETDLMVRIISRQLRPDDPDVLGLTVARTDRLAS